MLLQLKFIDKARAKYGLLPIKDIWQHWMGDNVIIGRDRELNAARENSAFAFTQTAFMLLPSKIDLPKNVVCNTKKTEFRNVNEYRTKTTDRKNCSADK